MQSGNKISTLLADILVPFAETASINPRDAGNTLKKRIIASLGFTDTRQLHDKLFPGVHLDWDAMLPYVQSVQLPVPEWCELVSLLHFIREPERPKHVTEMVTGALAGLKVSVQGKRLTPIESMQVSFARAGMAPSWDILAKSLLLCNLVDVDHSAALQYFLGNTASTSALIAHIGAHRHTQDEYTAVFYGMLCEDGCHVAAHHIIKSLRAREDAAERTRQNANATMRSTQKPSLTDMVERRLAAGGKKNHNGFLEFCSAARIQSNVSARVRRACYYVMSLPQGPAATTHAEVLRKLVGDDPVVLAALLPIETVVHPDLATIRLFLSEIQHMGEPPRCLRRFREAVFPGTTTLSNNTNFQNNNNGAGQHWSAMLRMYLAAYSRAPRDLLEGQTTMLIAPETEKMMNTYVSETPIALLELLPSLIGDDTF